MTWFVIAAAHAEPLLVDFLDIGQGDAIVVRHGDQTLLIDAGDRNKGIVAHLQALDVDRLEVVVATHPHADHIGGMPDVLAAYTVDRYLDNGLAHDTVLAKALRSDVEDRRIPYEAARAGDTWSWGDAVFTVVFPQDELLAETRSDLNSNSVVIRLDHGESSFLFTGDSEDPTERAMIATGLDPVDVLKVAHHGSEHSTSVAWIEALDPAFAVISVGTANRYGHPDPETLQRLDDAGVLVFRTDESHDVRILSDGTTLEFFEGPLSDLGPGMYRDLVGIENAPDPLAPPPGPRATAEPEKRRKWPCRWFHRRGDTRRR